MLQCCGNAVFSKTCWGRSSAGARKIILPLTLHASRYTVLRMYMLQPGITYIRSRNRKGTVSTFLSSHDCPCTKHIYCKLLTINHLHEPVNIPQQSTLDRQIIIATRKNSIERAPTKVVTAWLLGCSASLGCAQSAVVFGIQVRSWLGYSRSSRRGNGTV